MITPGTALYAGFRKVRTVAGALKDIRTEANGGTAPIMMLENSHVASYNQSVARLDFSDRFGKQT